MNKYDWQYLKADTLKLLAAFNGYMFYIFTLWIGFKVLGLIEFIEAATEYLKRH